MSFNGMTASDLEFFRDRGFLGHNGYSVMAERNAGRYVVRFYVQVRNGGWRAVKERTDSVYCGWVSDPFPDPISCYINAELVGWKE